MDSLEVTVPRNLTSTSHPTCPHFLLSTPPSFAEAGHDAEITLTNFQTKDDLQVERTLLSMREVLPRVDISPSFSSFTWV